MKNKSPSEPLGLLFFRLLCYAGALLLVGLSLCALFCSLGFALDLTILVLTLICLMLVVVAFKI